MPTYTFYDESSGIEWNQFLSIANKEKFLKENRQIIQVIVPIAVVGDHIMGVGPKPDSGWNENMQRIAEAHPSSPLADRYGSNEKNSVKKARDVVKKHMNK